MRYKGFIIERDATHDSEMYYIYRENGEHFITVDGSVRSISSVSGNIISVETYIDQLI